MRDLQAMALKVGKPVGKLLIMKEKYSPEFIAYLEQLMERSKKYLAMHEQHLREYDEDLAKAPAERKFDPESLAQLRAYAVRNIKTEKDMLHLLAGYLGFPDHCPPASS